jgi:hypothetical protein
MERPQKHWKIVDGKLELLPKDVKRKDNSARDLVPCDLDKTPHRLTPEEKEARRQRRQLERKKQKEERRKYLEEYSRRIGASLRHPYQGGAPSLGKR